MRAVIPLLAVRVCSSSRRPCPWGHRELAHIHNNGGTGGLFSRWFEPLPVQAPPHRRQGAPGPNVPRLAVWLSSSFDLWLRPRPRRLSTSLREVEAGAAIYRNKRAEGAPYAHPLAPAGGRGLPHLLRGAGTGTDRPRAGPRQLAARAYGLMSSSIADWGQKGQREAQNSQD